MSNTIMMVGDDGSVYKVKPKDVRKIATKVSTAKLSPDVQSHVTKAASKGAAHIFASKADIFAASKSDIFVAGKSDVLGSSSSDIFVSGKKAPAKKAAAPAKPAIFASGKKAAPPAKAEIFAGTKKKAPPAKADIFVSPKKES